MTRPVYDRLFLLIDGEWLTARGRETQPVIDPATEQTIGELPLASTDDLDRALTSAQRGFETWRAVSAHDRAKILKKGADLIRERAGDIAVQLSLEEGKTIAEARVEVATAAEVFEWTAEEGRRAYGRLIPPRQAGQRQLVKQEPIGPVAAFAPWNFPAITPARKIAAALAAGCSCIIKPAEETPATTLAMARALMDAGLPDGVLNVVFGVPADVSSYLLASPIIRKLSFTGSTAVGRHLAKLSADGVKRTTMELGGHAPVLVFDDADIDAMIPQAVAAKLRNSGQVCTSPTRFYVQEKVFDRFVADFSEALGKVKVGDGLDPDSGMGPYANERRVEAFDKFVRDAENHGAELITGGRRLGNGGYYCAPTVLANVPGTARIMSEEPFCSVAVINPVKTVDDAIAQANRLPYGLAAYAFTTGLATATAVGDGVESGMIGINTFNITMPETPFGGTKDSGYGSEGGMEGLQGYLQTKFISQV